MPRPQPVARPQRSLLAVIAAIFALTVSCLSATEGEQALDRALGSECGKAWTSLISLNDWLLGLAYPDSDEAMENLEQLASSLEKSGSDPESEFLSHLRRVIEGRAINDIGGFHQFWLETLHESWVDSYTAPDPQAPDGFASRRPKAGIADVLVWYLAAIEERTGAVLSGDRIAARDAGEATYDLGRQLMRPIQVKVHCDPERNYSGLDLDDETFRHVRGVGADFTGANLARARFLDGDLSEAIFERADLSYVVFTRMDLTGAAFTDTDTTNLYFVDSDLTGASFSGSVGLSDISWDGSICPDGSEDLGLGCSSLMEVGG